jgi:hypothetical protein
VGGGVKDFFFSFSTFFPGSQCVPTMFPLITCLDISQFHPIRL